MTNEELCVLIAQGNDRYVYPLWEQTDRLFYLLARRLFARHFERAAACGVELDDCLQVCWLAFLDAVEAFNRKPEQKVKFTSFADFHVKRHVYTLLGLRTTKREPLNGAASLDAPIGSEDGEYTLTDNLADKTAGEPFEDIERSELSDLVLERVDALPERQRLVIRRHYCGNMPLTEIAAGLNTSIQRASQIYRAALRKLRQDQRLREIRREFYEDADFTKHTGFQFFKENGMSSVEWELLRLEERIARVRGGDYG
ncbi:MAG: RNA polymerase sigma-H factor [Syntrophomonadaceae bacterium]|nr:RNA polymerase sigma-H factor [Bacillota bacterium]